MQNSLLTGKAFFLGFFSPEYKASRGKKKVLPRFEKTIKKYRSEKILVKTGIKHVPNASEPSSCTIDAVENFPDFNQNILKNWRRRLPNPDLIFENLSSPIEVTP